MKQFFSSLSKIRQWCLDLLYPIKCIGCGQEGEWWCQGCLNRVEYNIQDKCAVCRQVSSFGLTHDKCRAKTSLDGVIVSVSDKDKLVKNAVHKFKYNFVQGLGGALGQVLSNKILILKQSGFGFVFKELVLVPIPLHNRRLRWRGFNQAVILAYQVAKSFDWEVRTDILARVRYTRPQMKLKRKKRLSNIKNAFKLNKNFYSEEYFKGKDFLLVDDVLTTGATMEECARILRKAGASSVWGLVLSRG